jgi:pimeloyl-ACP methyl ester carboxylesterase
MTTTPIKVHFSINGDSTAGTLFVMGNKASKNVLFFHGGFPDDHSVFLPLAKQIASTQDCLIGVSCMPGYHLEEPWNFKPEGFTFNEMTQCCHDAIQTLMAQSSCRDARLMCILHDWGVLVGIQYVTQRQGTMPTQLVLFDVCAPPHPSIKIQAPTPSLYQVFTETLYRIVFAICFVLQRSVSSSLAQFIYPFCAFILFRNNIVKLGPVKACDVEFIEAHPVKKLIWMMYPYWHLLTSLLSSEGRTMLETFHLPPLEDMPVLYMYGLDKNAMFHDLASVQLLEQEMHAGKKSKIVPVKNAGHWLYVQQPDLCYQQVVEFCFGKKDN